MRIGAIVRSYKLTHFLSKVLRNLSDVDLLIVSNGSFKSVSDNEQDDTLKIVKEVDNKNTLVHLHHGQEQKDVFNTCMSFMRDMDYVLINDADEILLKKDREELISRMVEKRADAGMCTVIDYAPGLKRYPIRTHKPQVILKPEAVFSGNRSADYGQGVIATDIHLHHFGYAMEQPDMDWKYKNLWYQRHSFSEVVGQQAEAFEVPKEIIEIMNVK